MLDVSIYFIDAFPMGKAIDILLQIKEIDMANHLSTVMADISSQWINKLEIFCKNIYQLVKHIF